MTFRNLILVSFLLVATSPWGQNRFFQPADSLHKGRLTATSISIASLWTGSIIALNQVWYDGFEKTKLHTFDDSREWMQMDKMGHVFTAYQLSQQTAKLYRWTGLNRKKSAWLGTGIGFGYQLSFEFLDGRSNAWGFSWSDLAANGLGSALYLSQELIWEEQKFKLKFSYHPTEYAQYRPNTLGSNFSERLLKDYNGQTYWLTFSPRTLFPKSNIPEWISIAAGYSVDQKLAGMNDYYVSVDGLKTFDAEREFVLSLDIDVSKLTIQKKWLKTILSPFNIIKIPFPALVFQSKGVTGSWLYF
jgi:uncharacterized protein YfiM (DUF2279 family)